MEWVETTGRTLAEALDAALDQLGVDEQEAEVQILQEPQKGLFGRLRGEARVRARVRPVKPRPKAERRERRRRGDRDRDGRGRRGTAPAVTSGGRGAKGATSGNGSRTGRSGNKAGAEDRPVDAGDSRRPGGKRASSQAVEGEGASSGGGGSRRRRRRRGGSGRAKEQGAAVTDETSEAATAVATTTSTVDVEAQREAVDAFLRGLLSAFGRPEATVSVTTVEDDIVEAKVEGDELGLLVGPKGQTLQAVHELVRSMVQRRFVGEAHARVRVDVAGYRQRRREALERFTMDVTDQVLASGKAVVLDPMGASDRKTVHDVVNEIDGVKTVSEGEEPDRRVIIQPA